MKRLFNFITSFFSAIILIIYPAFIGYMSYMLTSKDIWATILGCILGLIFAIKELLPSGGNNE